MRLTIVQALPDLEAGGVERGTLEVAAELVKRGHRSIVISSGGRLVDQLVSNGSEHITMPIGRKSPLTLKYIPELRKILIKEKVNILHARSRFPAWICYFVWENMPAKNKPRFITTFHGPYSVNAYSRIMVKGEFIIAVSEFIRRYILENFPETDEKKIEVIPRGVDPGLFPRGYKPDPAWLDEWEILHKNIKGKFVIALPGRVTRRKGHEDFINVINVLITQKSPVHGLVIGGPHRGKERFFEQLKNKVKTARLDKHISFLGHRNDIREILSVSNVVLSLSKEPEAFGRTVLEALSLGTPVIAYDIGGTTEILKKIFPVGIVPHNNQKDIIAKIRDFIKQPPTVPPNCAFTLEQMLGKTIRLYEKTCSNQMI